MKAQPHSGQRGSVNPRSMYPQRVHLPSSLRTSGPNRYATYNIASPAAVHGPKCQIRPGSSPWLQSCSQSNDGTLRPNSPAKELASYTSSTEKYTRLNTIAADTAQSMNRVPLQNSARDFRFGENGPIRKTAAIQITGRARQAKLIHSSHGWRIPPLPAEKAASVASDPMPIATRPTLVQETTGCSRKARARAERNNRARAARRLFFRSRMEGCPDEAFIHWGPDQHGVGSQPQHCSRRRPGSNNNLILVDERLAASS